MEQQDLVQALADRLSRALAQGNSEAAVQLTQELSETDSELQLFLQPKSAQSLELRVPSRATQANPQVYIQLKEMGFGEQKANALARQFTSTEEALKCLKE